MMAEKCFRGLSVIKFCIENKLEELHLYFLSIEAS